MVGCADWPPVVDGPRIVATTSAHFSFAGGDLVFGAGLDYVWVISASCSLDVTRAICLFIMESALSISVRSSISSVTDSAWWIIAGGAISFPYLCFSLSYLFVSVWAVLNSQMSTHVHDLSVSMRQQNRADHDDKGRCYCFLKNR